MTAHNNGDADRNFNRPEQKDRRRELRTNATFAESLLWNALRGAQLGGRKFRRQHGIGRYIVDFYCAEERLVIEIDGDIHEEESVARRDAVREQALRDYKANRSRATRQPRHNVLKPPDPGEE